MKRISLLLLFAFLATASFAQFVGANSVGSGGGSSSWNNTTSFFKPHSDSYESGLLLKADLGWEFDHGRLYYGLALGYRLNQYLYAGIGVHAEHRFFFPVELRAYLPLQNFSFFIEGFWGPNEEFYFDRPVLGGSIGVNRRYWSLSFSVYEMPYYTGDYFRMTISLEYALPLSAISKKLYR